MGQSRLCLLVCWTGSAMRASSGWKRHAAGAISSAPFGEADLGRDIPVDLLVLGMSHLEMVAHDHSLTLWRDDAWAQARRLHRVDQGGRHRLTSPVKRLDRCLVLFLATQSFTVVQAPQE